MNETDILHDFIARVPFALPSVRVFRRNVLNVKTAFGRVRNGIKGQADAYALVEGGRHVELEAKSATGSLSKPQRKWQAFCLEFRIPHLVLKARRNEAPADTVARWVEELRTAIEATRD